jgi:hypothetical protein
MNPIKATWINGSIVPAEPVDWPEGSELIVAPVATPGKIGLDESEWRDDAEALAAWDAWLPTVEPLVLIDEERAAFASYREELRKYNLEAVRRQMASGDEP